PGGVSLTGGWPEVWRANLCLRGAVRVLARIGEFLAFHPAQLDKRARKFPWEQVLRPDVPVVVEATSHASQIWHAGAARDRIARAIAEELGAVVIAAGGGAEDAAGSEAPVRVLARLDDNRVTLSVDTSGEPLHKRGAKVATGKAPMRETMAAMLLRAAGLDGREPVVDPMCGSGTFIIEAAEIAAGFAPGRSRGFAFERLATFDPGRWAALRTGLAGAAATAEGPPRCFGFDRDEGAIRGAEANAGRAGVAPLCRFARQPVSDLCPPEGLPPGLVIANPPYGTRIGERKPLFALYGAFGQVLLDRFAGWRAAIVTTDEGLARATGLPFLPPGPPVLHGGLKVRLWQTGPLP
ncbi:MAG: class I SAM-dependent RNA methyltransferase, partial [Paracoccaceae bacterium]